jgi:hypothetical protein
MSTSTFRWTHEHLYPTQYGRDGNFFFFARLVGCSVCCWFSSSFLVKIWHSLLNQWNEIRLLPPFQRKKLHHFDMLEPGSHIYYACRIFFYCARHLFDVVGSKHNNTHRTQRNVLPRCRKISCMISPCSSSSTTHSTPQVRGEHLCVSAPDQHIFVRPIMCKIACQHILRHC